MQSGLSISLASRDADRTPSLSKGLGCRVRVELGEVRIFTDATHAQELLRDIADCRRLAVVLSEVGTHRTLQIKASDARVEPLDDDDRRACGDYVRRFGATLQAMGFPGSMVEGYLACRIDDLRAVVCHPDEAFQQTPGPQAGRRIGTGA